MTRLNLDSCLFQPWRKPDSPRRGGNNTLTHTIIIWCGLREAIYSKCLFFIHEVRLWIPSIIPILTLRPAVYFRVICTLYYDACGRSEDLTDWSIDDFHCIHELVATWIYYANRTTALSQKHIDIYLTRIRNSEITGSEMLLRWSK